ncbi:MAG: alpha/beta fold hydrolase [Allomuricauda sp.]
MDLKPQTKYAKSGDVNLAYQVIGKGEEYLILIPGWVSNIEDIWNIPQLSAWLSYLASFMKIVVFDKRGTGLSDRVNEDNLPNIEQRSEDLKIILRSIGVERASFLGLSEGGPLAIFLAAKFPQMVGKLVLIGSFAKWVKTEDYPIGLTKEEHDQILKFIFSSWGKPVGLGLMAPSVKNDSNAQEQWARFLRRSASPNTARIFYEMNTEIDVRHLLEKVDCPTLILHRTGDLLIEYGHGKYLSDKIKGSKLIATPGKDHLPWFGVKSAELIALQTFLKDGIAIENKKLETLNPKDIFIVYEVKDHLTSNFHKQHTIKSLSRKFGINEYKLKSGFKSLFGKPLITFLTDFRLQKACEFLSHFDETVATVSEKVGYQHSNNFSIAFKRKYGITPSQFQAKLSGEKEN